MKTKNIFILPLIICAVVATFNCTGKLDTSKLIVKKWQWVSYQNKSFDDEMAELKRSIDTTKDSVALADIKYSIKQMSKALDAIKYTTTEFNLDGSFKTLRGEGDVKEATDGKWSVSADGKKLILTATDIFGNVSGNPDTSEIIDITNDKLVWAGYENKRDKSKGRFTLTCEPAPIKE